MIDTTTEKVRVFRKLDIQHYDEDEEEMEQMQDLKKLMKQSSFADQEIDSLIETLIESGVI